MRNPLRALKVRVLDSLADAAMLQDRIGDRVERRADEKLTPRLSEIDRVIDRRVQECRDQLSANVKLCTADLCYQMADDEWLQELIGKGQHSIAYEIYAKMRRVHCGDPRIPA